MEVEDHLILTVPSQAQAWTCIKFYFFWSFLQMLSLRNGLSHITWVSEEVSSWEEMEKVKNAIKSIVWKNLKKNPSKSIFKNQKCSQQCYNYLFLNTGLKLLTYKSYQGCETLSHCLNCRFFLSQTCAV